MCRFLFLPGHQLEVSKKFRVPAAIELSLTSRFKTLVLLYPQHYRHACSPNFLTMQLGSQLGKYLGSGNRVLYDTDRGPGLHRSLTPLAAAVEGQRTSHLRAAIHAVRWLSPFFINPTPFPNRISHLSSWKKRLLFDRSLHSLHSTIGAALVYFCHFI